MSADLEFTGERYVPGTLGEIAHEHWHRYAFARGLVGGKRVLDVACGEGYGSALLALEAAQVTGVDVDAQTIAHAQAVYADRGNVRFVEGSAAALPLENASFDAVVSFETIEHVEASDQVRMLEEFARVLTAEGLLILSSPNRPEYSEARNYVNPFHLHELDREELARLLQPHFPAQRWYRQRRYLGSALWSEDADDRYEASTGDATSVASATLPEAMYFVVLAARSAGSLPRSLRALSLFTDTHDAEVKRIEHEAQEVLRLDGLLRARDGELREQIRHSRELDAMVQHRDQVIDERTRSETALRVELAALSAEHERLTREVDAQERIIVYRQSVRWWLKLPWIRARRLWNRIRAA